MNTQSFDGRVVIVTGAGKGIGQASAIAFAKLGARLVLNSRSKQPLEETLSAVEQTGAEAVMSVGDVSDERVSMEGVALAVKEFGQLDFAVNNAGISPWVGNTAEYTFQDWQRVININLTGTWLGMKYQIPAMLQSGGGAIVNMTSVACAEHLRRLLPLLCEQMGDRGHHPRGGKGIRRQGYPGERHRAGVDRHSIVGGCCSRHPPQPGGLRKTDSNEADCQSRRGGRSATWLCSDAAAYVTGIVLPVDGGITL
jgi:NAD(P)-dependent dehydrogenase (short-subunit alcohol dehydrogenase family)